MQKILLYYKFTPVKDPEMLKLWQKTLCDSLNLHGRILVSAQGINGTVGGDIEDLKAYVKKTKEFPGFKDILWKWSEGGRDNFPRMSVKVKKELVAFETWDEIQVVGFVRAITDFSSCCYIAELAIDTNYRQHGIDRQLMRMVAEELPPECDILFLSTESNHTGYLKLGFSQSPRAWHTNAKNFLDKLNESQ